MNPFLGLAICFILVAILGGAGICAVLIGSSVRRGRKSQSAVQAEQSSFAEAGVRPL